MNDGDIPAQTVDETAFGILQAARLRTSKTEYISCPGCGRTLYDLRETIAKIKEATKHLKGLKIGIMGCIVNGPGEMADADYGYVGAGPNRVSSVCINRFIILFIQLVSQRKPVVSSFTIFSVFTCPFCAKEQGCRTHHFVRQPCHIYKN